MAQGFAKVFFERIDPDALDGFVVAVQVVLPDHASPVERTGHKG